MNQPADRTNDLYAAANRWVELARQRAQDGKSRAFVLPALDGSEKLHWFLAASSAAEYARLVEEANAFFGVTLLTDPVKPYPLTGANKQQKTIQAFLGNNARAGRISPGDSNSERAQRSLQKAKLWAAVAVNAADRSDAAESALGGILRKFRLACAAQDRPTAENCLRVLRERGLMETRNRVFLQVQMLAAFAERDATVWEEICSLPTFPDLVVALRPRAVTEALICAVYHVHLAPDIPKGNAALCGKFAEEVYPQFAPLYRARGKQRTPRNSKIVSASRRFPRRQTRARNCATK